ncbi:MAG: hypothetical protein LBD28_05650 [Tannerellaceae bacterium]|jgi:hypothetical protein|nr:hypothetical protein [Tannerellaceae bacterium]
MNENVFTGALAAILLLLSAGSCSNEVPAFNHVIDDITTCPCEDNAEILRVGPNKTFKTIKEAAEAAGDNMIIEIDAGTYKGDVAFWNQNNLVIRAVGGDVILDANGQHFGGKGIWEINGGNVCVEGITFINAKVPDQNGAGIRLTEGNLTVIACKFLHNEMGILTGNTNTISLTVRNSEFGYGGYGDGFSHNIYVGRVGSLHISGSYFHHARRGHLIKTRAALSYIYCNLIADGTDAIATASYEIDVPDGGQAIIVGNVIQKSATPDNPHVISFAKESASIHPVNKLFVAHNTIINHHNGDNYVLGAPASGVEIYFLNNAIQASAKFNAYIPMNVEKGNVLYNPDELGSNNYPVASSVAAWKSALEANIDSYLPQDLKSKAISLVPSHQYVSPTNIKQLNGQPNIPGAVQVP